MANQTQILAELLIQLRASIGSLVKLQIIANGGDSLTIQVGNHADAIVSVAVKDERRPSFSISYPKLSIKRNGDRHVSTVTSDDVLFDGVTWVIGEMAEHGVVMPEFSN